MTRKSDLEREKCGRNFYAHARKLDTSLLPCSAAQGYRVTLPLKIGSRENTDVETVSLSFFFLSLPLSLFLPTRLRRRNIDFQARPSKIEENFFFQWRAEGDYVEKNVSSRNKEETS